ncbi:MAG: 2-amino-4-hydroxy-6-hydroxymethyldihydropteridine diphosphokinase [Novosphingobium sp. 28-62-57]|nr:MULTISPECIES: 2-amino-4-hydroxy-6-hydroxymethyldihydropteridine diphosphokinase [unclassified Novosphingobium]OYW49272.1 MAG: 2-amino-4-hydroxy-6-hydroxymethyldihydropteridine diphosphokinase [Novosphingobium sp. 12-62-10]OYZ09866.1 MAG: 2-amino-4-hydroxy-6-hydroxymethyldihydropteridine diphosphokinase [Novosphingobium sp. 28-62-57]OZA37480.1 MAG: 2-amino-4-hydroxy-6-hydroxymethyldihydropteridine diphosphokinase [Novosphingobium sp. 17-62-9]HQS69067.1 2-amino-4-hydroxy-6-hydroxymethyldihydro
MTAQRYLVALGSNQRHHRHGAPAAVIRAALADLAVHPIRLVAVSPLIRSRPVGPSQREYVNGAAVVETRLDPPALLDVLQDIEARFGRKRQGQRWRARTLDLDIVLWSGGCWSDELLTIPHREFRKRAFVLCPAARIARLWRDPVTGHSVGHLEYRIKRRVDRSALAP